ncbi:MAG: hypothetical protein IKE65_04625 [Clostridia bacterium]|nr:hypothetical protein [Clostridia bacterium]
MPKQEQKKFDKAAQKKALIGNGIILFVLVIGIILAVFAWFSQLDNHNSARGMNIISNDNLDIRFNTYPGVMQNNGKVIYDEHAEMNLNNPDFDENTNVFSMYPGQRRYFKTVISNYETSSYTGNFILQNILVSKKLVSTDEQVCIIFGSDLGSETEQQAFDLAPAADYKENDVVSTTQKIVHAQPIYQGVVLPGGTNDGGNIRPSTVEVYWYVLLNGDAVGNDVMGEQMMKLQSIKFVTAA